MTSILINYWPDVIVIQRFINNTYIDKHAFKKPLSINNIIEILSYNFKTNSTKLLFIKYLKLYFDNGIPTEILLLLKL